MQFPIVWVSVFFRLFSRSIQTHRNRAYHNAPVFVDIEREIERLRQELKKNEDAISYLEKYLQLSPNAKDAAQMNYTIAALAQTMGNKEKAKAFYQKIVTDPKFGPTAQEMLKSL